MANVGLPHASIREAIALAIDIAVHLERVGHRRQVTQVVHVRGYDPRNDQFDVEAQIHPTALTSGVAA